MPVEMSWVEDGWPDGKPLSCGAWNNGNGSGHAIAVDVDKNTAESLAASKAEELAGNEYTKGWRCPDGCTPSRDDPNNASKIRRAKLLPSRFKSLAAQCPFGARGTSVNT